MIAFNLFSYEVGDDYWSLNLCTFVWADGEKSASLLFLDCDYVNGEIGFDFFGLVAIVDFISEKLEKR